MEYPILKGIKAPQDVKRLDSARLQALCAEIRDCIINTVSKNGGHLASNLGAVELTVALHRVFNSPDDSIIFDVGHQCYAHKLLTGRFERFDTLRTEGGLSGFMNPFESEHDAVITGHSSNSISEAYGIYKAKQLSGQSGTAVAVIGDGAMTGGIAYEAMNNAGNGKGNFIIVLNDNKMSISQNVGAFARSLTKMRNKPKYHRFKSAFSSFLLNLPLIGKGLNKLLFSLKESLKLIVYKNNFFTSMGLNYLGPVDGHNIAELESILNIARNYDKPSLVHVVTTKGKGYAFAESSPKNYHGVSPFDIDEGIGSNDNFTFSRIAGNTLCELAEKDKKICAITAAMTEGTGLVDFAGKFKDRFFDVGIAEQHALSFSAGLAVGGMKPYFVVYSSFLQRAYDQIVHDAATANVPVKLLIDRAGIVGEDGVTHQGLFDVSFLTGIPNMTVYSPSNFEELAYRIKRSAEFDGVCAVRYPRGSEKNCGEFDIESDYYIVPGSSEKLIVTYGRLYSEAYTAHERDNEISILKLNKIYPLSDDIAEVISTYDNIHIFEETEISGGIGEHISAKLLKLGFGGKLTIHAVDNKFLPGSPVSSAIKSCGLDADTMFNCFTEN